MNQVMNNRVLALMTLMLNQDQGSLKRIQALAKDKGNGHLEEAAYLLGKGISIEESRKVMNKEAMSKEQ